jgi:hypothetical protein
MDYGPTRVLCCWETEFEAQENVGCVRHGMVDGLNKEEESRDAGQPFVAWWCPLLHYN